MSERTSKKVARVAAKTLRDKRASKRAKTLAASALTQVEPDASRRKVAGYCVCYRSLRGKWSVVQCYQTKTAAKANLPLGKFYVVVPVSVTEA